MFDFSSGSRATRDHTMPPSEQTPITAECFLPPRISCPRAWQRVAVAPVPGLRRQPKIWKRVGGLATTTGQDAYSRAMAELEQQGQNARKRVRHAQHIPAWGDARWDPRAESEHDGTRDLEDARATVAAAENDGADAATTDHTHTRRATFPEDSLKWVPRKRHNTRWPIEPKREHNTRVVPDSQPPADSKAPASPEPVEIALRMDEQQMKSRSTRRLSRRISLFPGEDSPRKLPMISLSPADGSAPAPSPVKRAPVTLSPTKVADSPLRSFRVNATPTKVVLESPQINPPAPSPAKSASSPLTPAAKAAQPTSTTQSPASSAPLLFDQPMPDVQPEPQHEARRRLSLQAARRSERGSSGASRLLALKTGRNSPSRRHSFTSVDHVPVDAREDSKSRRNTMDGFCLGPDALRAETAAVAHPNSGEAVEVDMKASLDIFGRVNKTESALGQPISGELADSEAEPNAGEESASTSLTNDISSIDEGVAASDAGFSTLTADDSVSSDGAEVAEGADDASSRQAAPSPTGEQLSRDFIPQPSHAAEPVAAFSETHESGITFAAHEREGLSTIYEESYIVQDQRQDESAAQQAAQSPSLDTTSHASADEEPMQGEMTDHFGAQSEAVILNGSVDEAAPSTPRSPEHDFSNSESDIDAIQMAADEQLLAESAHGTPLQVNMPTGHVAGVHATSSPDSPVQASAIEIQQQVPELPETATEMSHSSPTIGPEEDEVSLLPERPTEGPGSPSLAVVSTPLPGTPTTAPGPQLMDRVVTPEADERAVATQQESSGFTPINGRQTSPPNIPPSMLQDEDAQATDAPDELDADEVVEEEVTADAEDDATVAIDEDMLTVEAPYPKNDTLQLQARHDDSETEMLRDFVTRMTADKNAKAAAAAAALAKKVARRSGSLGSITSSTGSPMARPVSETPGSRTPLGVKSPNSPTPSKKRKLELVEDDLAKDKPSQDSSNQPRDDGPRLKRRRSKRTDPILQNDSSTTLSPEPDSLPSSSTTAAGEVSGPRRSTRSRSTRVALKPAAPSANSIALSMIPVRLPGMGAIMDEAAMDAHLAALARQRSEEKDLAAVTRGNTRKNKGSAVPPQVVLARQAEDPAWRMRELKGVFEAREMRKGKDRNENDGDIGRKGKKGKGVRWAEELVRYQSEEAPSVYRGMARELLADVMMADEIAEAEPPAVGEKPVEKTARVAVRRAGGRSSAAATAAAPSVAAEAAPAPARRTRSSRLPPPTPVKKLAAADKPVAAAEKAAAEKAAAEKAAAEKAASAPPSLRTRARLLPKLAPAPAPSAVPEPPAVASTRSGMATRRTRVANGTPAPKRRGRAAV